MAQKVLVQLIDDLDGTPTDDVSTVEFGLDGATYEIDLSDSNAQRLRDTLADYVGSARRVGGRIKRGTKPHSGRDTNDAAQVREWANANGHELSARGRIPGHVVEAYRQAQNTPKSAKPKQGTNKPARGRRKAD